MKLKCPYLLVIFAALCLTTPAYAQPSNDTCGAAIPITVTAGSCNSILYTNVAATTTGDPATPACWLPNSMSHSVWFSFTATTADIEISTNFGGTLANTQIAVFSGSCGSLTQIACQEDINTGGGLFHTNVILHGLTIGNTYYIVIDGNGNSTGTFGICAQETLPVGPPLPVQDCATAQTLCNTSNITVPNGIGGVGVSQENPSCFGAPGERASNWYTFTVATSGNLCFAITPTAVIDYDFAVYNTSSSCPGTELSCNWSPTTGVAGTTGLGCAGGQCNACLAVTAGQTYTILVDRYTASSSAGFTMSFGGTTATFASPNPTFTATTACVGNATQFTNTTNGNFTYNWTFGDGFTSNLENPSHTYAAAGTYNVTLLLTAVPGGCQNAITQSVTVNPLPTVDAGTGGTVCSGNCITLGGTTNAVGSVGPVSFSNTNSYAIPDGSTTGVNAPITVSGVSPVTIANASINSVCINLTHPWDSDLDIFLVAPNGTTIELSTDNGGLGDNYTNTCFTPTAGTAITAGAAPFTGTFSPEQAFSLLNGSNANGTWQLFVQDDVGGDIGTINSWSIEFNNNLPAFTWSPTTAMTNSTTLSPTVCPTATTTYTLTANNGVGCTTTDTVTINVTAATTTPTFTAVDPICSGASLAALPTTSNNGITGTWSPALNNTATTTYTFTPTAGQCAIPTTLTITVNPNVTPTFTAVAPICSGGTLSALPTTSNNGVTGTWSPALNNTATTTYTFTPTAGLCALPTTLTITVNPNVVPTFTAIAPICSGATLSALPTTSNNGITGTWSPALNNTATTTYTFTPTAGLCAVPTTLTITVNPNVTPTFTAVAPICSGGTLSALSTTSNNGITGTWAPALNNTATTTYTFTPTAGQCAVPTTLTITVNPNITPTFTAVAPICSGETLSALPTTSNNGITGTWSPALNNTATTTYTFTPTAGQCAVSTTLMITVNPNITPTFTAVAPICSGGTLSALPTTSNNGITGTWSPALNNTATTTYTFTPTAGLCALPTTLTITVNPNITPTFTAIAPICSGGTLSALPTTSNNGITGTWSPALDNTATTTYTFTPTFGQCALSTTLTITVNPNITPTFTAVAPICSGGMLSALPTTSNNGITGSWVPVLNNTTTTTYTFTPTAGLCAVPTTLTITVNPNPTIIGTLTFCNGSTSQLSGSGTPAVVSPWISSNTTVATVNSSGLVTGVSNGTSIITYTDNNSCSATATVTVATNITPTFTAVAPICSGGTLSALPTISNNGITGIWAPAINNAATTTYTFTPTAGQCAVSTTLTITVNPNITPTFAAVAPICNGATLSALPTTSNNGITGIWAPAINNAATTTYTFTPTAGQCAVSTTLTITVNTNITPTFAAVAPICNGATLSALPTTSNNGITGTWAPALDNTNTTTYTFTPTAGLCAVPTTLTITVNPNITPTFTAVAPICSGGTLSALPTTSNNGITGIWSPALDNTGTTTYTFTPTAGLCAVPTTLTITVNPNITPIFTAVAPICSGGALVALPTTSNNGITGTWSPALNNTATTTYTFTPTAGLCAVSTTLTITVNPNITPTFTAIAPICSGGTLSALPTTSNNGITGTWLPALDNTATTTYTFTPTAGLCAVSTTLTITVNPNITPTFTAVAPICSGGTLSVLPTTSNNGITGTWAPALDNTNTTTYTFTPNAGQCAISTTLTITVNPNITPTFNAVAPICSGGTLSVLPTTSNNGIAGTWSPALNNLATTTYTFTPTVGICATTNTLTIIVYSLPQINAIAPLYYCDPNNDGFGTFDLTQVIPTVTGGVPYPVSFHETVTDAEINGTTIPTPSAYDNIHVDAQTIYIRVESTESSGCYEILTLELIVNPTPEAIEPQDYHICDDNHDGFASFNLNTRTLQILGSISLTTHSIGYFTSLSNAQSNNNPINNITAFINQTINTQTIWVRVTNNATGCYDIVTLQLIVDPLPLATQPNYAPYSLCDYSLPLGYEEFDLASKISDILLGQMGMNVRFYYSETDALEDVDELPLLYTNVEPYVQTIWVKVENANTRCSVLSTMDLRVEPLPSPIPQNEPYTICDGNQDGFSTFDLTTLTVDILQGADYTITYHETATDALLGNNPLISPYDNISPFVQYIYASALDNSNGCRSIIPIELNVEPQPIMPIDVPDLIQCDEDNNTQNQTMFFDLTQNTSMVLAAQEFNPSNFTVTYYTSQADAIDGIAPIIPATNYVGSNHEIIWVRIENNTSHCFAIGSFELLVNPPLLLTTPTPLSLCDSDDFSNNQYTTFDLTVKELEITQGQVNMTVTYYPSYPVTALSIPIDNPIAYTNILPGVQTLGVMVSNAQGCRSYTSLDIRVLPVPTPNTNGLSPLAPQCDVNNTGDMLEVFDLTINAALIINGDPTLVLHYYPSPEDAMTQTNEIMNPSAALVGENVWIRVENNRIDYLGNHCFALVEQPLTVNPLPTIIQPLTVQNCDDDTDGQALFDLTDTTPTLLGNNQSPTDFTITYYTTAASAQSGTNAIANPTNYTNQTNPQIIYIRVVNNTTGCVNYGGQFTLVVNPKPTAVAPANFATCDTDGTNDGYFTLDLSAYISGIIGSQTGANTTFHDNQADAENGTNAITDLANYQAYSHTLWIRVENTTTGCYQLASFVLTVEPLAEPQITSAANTICVEYGTNILLSGLTLNSGITNPNYTFAWSLDGVVIPGATSSTYDITAVAPGDYTVIATSLNPPLLGCTSLVSNTFTVIQSGPAQASEPAYTVSNPFGDNQIITVNVVGYGQYEFSLDDGPFQSSNVFENATLHPHTITIRDVKGNTSCGEIVIENVLTIDYPHYFTPNGDGYHDTWNVTGLANRPAKLYIFDRYGKLLKQISTSGEGWDGTYNGHLMPATDYWFKVEYQNGAQWNEFRAHFSLKR
ncbi:T9SS type B sorting domain-containing protein [Flavobacterium terrisoli]|uniref:T9SS type B sorting domain-containing protein n=1 Tax=Flavobacterium terrisoli TaxID=3242195 RepID=UPI0025431271|nr:T9SS type B sorting domain-containing protein [Flavobacterium buctense]